jgi:alpha-amylase/alpha-mannosidase (GH57 family)
MQIWHLTPDAGREPRRVSAGQVVRLRIGTWPVEPDQSVMVHYQVEHRDGPAEERRLDAAWQSNRDGNSYWEAQLGPFADGDRIAYTVRGYSPAGEAAGPSASFLVGPAIYLALLWHQHQPLYRDLGHSTLRGSVIQPWVRLHALRDYYAMAALVERHPGIHVTINLTPVLLSQLEDYITRGATDRALDLTLTPAGRLTRAERREVLATFFDAHWHNQIFPHPRYKELFALRQDGVPLRVQDLRDLQMWFNLAWFGTEFRRGAVELVTGETASVQRFVEQGHGFTAADIREMVREQYKIIRAVVPLHRRMQDQGQIEVSTTPFSHPILPLIHDSDRATIDLPGSVLPGRFAHPRDADAQVSQAIDAYRQHFGREPHGMWPAEGAVSEEVISYFGRHGVRWIASDRGVLARSGRWGYDAEAPDVLCQPYRSEADGCAVSVFFRDPTLADRIGFHYHGYPDADRAAREFLETVRERFARRLPTDADRILTVVLDGENAWGEYREDARPFLHALYELLERDPEIRTVTFREYLEGNPERGVLPHPTEHQARVHDLFPASWIDEPGSAPGVDLGTWIGEDEENQAWNLLEMTRSAVARAGAQSEAAIPAVLAAEGSDWFWWYGADQDSGNDAEFDDLFRLHLKSAYRALGVDPPAVLDRHIVPRTFQWAITHPVGELQTGDRLTVRTNCPGLLTWWLDDGRRLETPLSVAGGVMAGVQRYHVTVGPFPPAARELRFRFRCTHPDCPGNDICCSREDHVVRLVSSADASKGRNLPWGA